MANNGDVALHIHDLRWFNLVTSVSSKDHPLCVIHLFIILSFHYLFLEQCCFIPLLIRVRVIIISIVRPLALSLRLSPLFYPSLLSLFSRPLSYGGDLLWGCFLLGSALFCRLYVSLNLLRLGWRDHCGVICHTSVETLEGALPHQYLLHFLFLACSLLPELS